MKLGIMQPYFFPYIGYWQLMNAVDKYVIYDDVNYIKGGWINRNRILVNRQPKYFNVPMIGASPYKLINEIEVNNDPRIIAKNLRVIENSYKKAPYYQEAYFVIDKILNCTEKNLASYLINSLQIICSYLDIKTEVVVSSSLKKDCSLKGQDKVISICKLLGATEYYNAIGGRELYFFSTFEKEKIKLKFLETNKIVYEQFNNNFYPNLSIIDVMMFNDKETVKKMLGEYQLK